MTTYLREYHREKGHMPITVVAQNAKGEALLSESFQGHIIDISYGGACLLLPDVIKDAYHIFHTTRENDSSVLQLTMTVPSDNIHFSIAARPVWFDLFNKDNLQAYKMGVEFTSAPDKKEIKQLMSTMRASQHPKLRSRWRSYISAWKTTG